MSEITFKKFVECVDNDLSDEQLNELFGLFKNNTKIEKLKAEREKLKAKRKMSGDELDQALKDWGSGKKPGQVVAKQVKKDDEDDDTELMSADDRKVQGKLDRLTPAQRDAMLRKHRIREGKSFTLTQPGWYVVDHMDKPVAGPMSEGAATEMAKDMSTGHKGGDIQAFDVLHFYADDVRQVQT